MKKKFNITGICFPHLHYMMDISAKFRQTLAMVEGGEYFIINRPRQYGKTTMLGQLQSYLSQSETYIPIKLNFQGIDSKWHESDQAFARMFLSEIQIAFKFVDKEIASFLEGASVRVNDMGALSEIITELCYKLSKKPVLLIDEVDASSNYEPFLNFLGMLRNKYLSRFEPQHITFHSIVLAGVHDIKSLKFKLRNPEEAQYNSPWNIAADFKVQMSFTPPEIEPMLREYAEAEDVEMDIPEIAQKLFYYTSGYPFLVSKLCKIIAEDMQPEKGRNHWTLADVETAVQLLLKEQNTNFDSLIKNLENNDSLYQLVYRVIMEGEEIPNNPDEPIINIGQMYGIFRSNGRLKIHNRIYEQRIYNYMTARTIVSLPKIGTYARHFQLPDNQLDMPAILLKFQQFMKEQYTDKNDSFLETHGRLVFLSFLAPILNGQGYSFKEVQVSMEKRLDIVVTYHQHRYIIELKRWYGPQAHEKGLDQLADYLELHGLDQGYLLIFDGRQDRAWEQEQVTHGGKEVFAVWV